MVIVLPTGGGIEELRIGFIKGIRVGEGQSIMTDNFKRNKKRC